MTKDERRRLSTFALRHFSHLSRNVNMRSPSETMASFTTQLQCAYASRSLRSARHRASPGGRENARQKTVRSLSPLSFRCISFPPRNPRCDRPSGMGSDAVEFPSLVLYRDLLLQSEKCWVR